MDDSEKKIKNILFVLPNLQGGGAERVVLTILRYLDTSKYSLTLFLFKREGVYWNEIPSNVRVICVLERGRLRLNLHRIFLLLLKEAKSQDVLVGGLELISSYMVYLAGWLVKKPAIGMVHISLPDYLQNESRIRNWLAKRFYARMKRLVFVSNGAVQSMRKWLPATDYSFWSVIYDMLDTNVYKENSVLPEWTKQAYQAPVVIAVGRLAEQKGFDLLLIAHKKLINLGIRHNLVILGEGPQRNFLEQKIRDLDIAGSVFLPGFVDNPIHYMKMAKIFILSSRYEGFGMVIVEAMIAGLPVISTDCRYGPAEILDHGKYGLLVPPENPDTIAEAIKKLLLDNELCNHFIELNQERVSDFSPERIIPQWERLLDEVTS